MWIVVAHNQFNYCNWRWVTLTTTSHLQEESLSQRTLRATMTMWERQPNIYTFLLLKYCWFTSLNDCIPKEPAIKGQYRGLVRGRHDDSIDSPMVLLNSELMLFTSFLFTDNMLPTRCGLPCNAPAPTVWTLRSPQTNPKLAGIQLLSSLATILLQSRTSPQPAGNT